MRAFGRGSRSLMLLAALAAAASLAQAAGDGATPADGQVKRPTFGKRIDMTSLAAVRGGTDTTSDSTLAGTVANNQAVNVTSGSNVITGGSFAGASGVPVVIQNSGSNVLIQSSTVITVNLK